MPRLTDVRERAAHYQHKANCRKKEHNRLVQVNYYLSKGMGITVIILTTVVGTRIFGYFSKMQGDSGVNYQIITGLISLLAAVLSALQTFLGFQERGEKNKIAAAEYEAVNNKLSTFFLRFQDSDQQPATYQMREEAISALESIIGSFQTATENSPSLSPAVEDRYFEKLNNKAFKS